MRLFLYLFLFINTIHFLFSYEGLWEPYIGSFNGQYDLSVGTHLWNNRSDLRNLQFRTDLDLYPGFRLHSIIRSNREFNEVETFEPTFDELYLEKYFFYKYNKGKISFSLKTGNMRYLRFPEPDIISMFDHVPGTEDLRFEDTETGYKGILATFDFKSNYKFGLHSTYIDWFEESKESNFIENYLYYKDNFHILDFEARYGYLQLRHPIGSTASARGTSPYQLGESGLGYDIYFGLTKAGYRVGLLYENIRDLDAQVDDIRTGILVEFADSLVTKALGSVRFDYTRTPEGFGVTLPLLHGNIGNLKSETPENSNLVGEVYAFRTITYWQNGQGRNFYEHRNSYWGDVESEDLIIVLIEKPWYLKVESLVSPNTSFNSKEDLVQWEAQRQGPAELRQEVIYRYYRKKTDNK